MRVVFHYAAGPELAARLAALEGLEVEVCPEADDGRFAALVAEAEVLWHVLRGRARRSGRHEAVQRVCEKRLRPWW